MENKLGKNKNQKAGKNSLEGEAGKKKGLGEIFLTSNCPQGFVGMENKAQKVSWEEVNLTNKKKKDKLEQRPV